MGEVVHVASAAQMDRLGQQFAGRLAANDIVFLEGELGSGKTTFVRGVMGGLGYQLPVKSPTYTLVEPYETASFRVFHLDLYRLADPEELELLGGRDLWGQGGVCFIEWPHQGRGFLPPPTHRIHFDHDGDGRQVEIVVQDPISAGSGR